MNSEETSRGALFFFFSLSSWVFKQVNPVLFQLSKFILLFLNMPFSKGFQDSCVAMGAGGRSRIVLEFSP